MQIHARLAASPRAVADPDAADLFHIPYYSWQLGHPPTHLRKCGVDFVHFGDAPKKLWTWLLAQESFQKSDCSNHFVVLSEVNDFLHVVRLAIRTPC